MLSCPASLIAGLSFVAITLRPQIVGIGPLLPEVQDDLGVSHEVVGLLHVTRIAQALDRLRGRPDKGRGRPASCARPDPGAAGVVLVDVYPPRPAWRVPRPPWDREAA